MKKALLKSLLVLSLGAFSINAFGFGRQIHASIVYIAEQNLTPTAKKNVQKVLDGKSLVYYASYCDAYKQKMLIDLGWEPSNSKRITTLPHTVSIETATGKACDFIRHGDEYIVNLIPFVLEAQEMCRNHLKEMDDSTRLSKVLIMIHQLGDMHCFGHIREFPLLDPEHARCYYDVKWKGEVIRYHTFLDQQFFDSRYPWSFSDVAHILDNYTDAQHREFASGSIYDWAEDVYKAAQYTLSVKEGMTITNDMCDRIRHDQEEIIVKAGYRLARMLNEAFDPKYKFK